MDLFNFPRIQIDKPIRLIELFGGIGTHGYANAHVCTEYRIRKLTEKECFRLMGFKDSDFEKARAVNSATQIYKQAGNSIVKQVLMAIFLQMNIQGLKPWNDRNEDEIRELIK